MGESQQCHKFISSMQRWILFRWQHTDLLIMWNRIHVSLEIKRTCKMQWRSRISISWTLIMCSLLERRNFQRINRRVWSNHSRLWSTESPSHVWSRGMPIRHIFHHSYNRSRNNCWLFAMHRWICMWRRRRWSCTNFKWSIMHLWLLLQLTGRKCRSFI